MKRIFFEKNGVLPFPPSRKTYTFVHRKRHYENEQQQSVKQEVIGNGYLHCRRRGVPDQIVFAPSA